MHFASKRTARIVCLASMLCVGICAAVPVAAYALPLQDHAASVTATQNGTDADFVHGAFVHANSLAEVGFLSYTASHRSPTPSTPPGPSPTPSPSTPTSKPTTPTKPPTSPTSTPTSETPEPTPTTPTKPSEPTEPTQQPTQPTEEPTHSPQPTHPDHTTPSHGNTNDGPEHDEGNTEPSHHTPHAENQGDREPTHPTDHGYQTSTDRWWRTKDDAHRDVRSQQFWDSGSPSSTRSGPEPIIEEPPQKNAHRDVRAGSSDSLQHSVEQRWPWVSWVLLISGGLITVGVIWQLAWMGVRILHEHRAS